MHMKALVKFVTIAVALISNGAFITSSHAATFDFGIDFPGGDTTVTQNGPGFGNSITAVDEGLSVEIFAFGATGGTLPTEILQTAEIYFYAGTGLGACNQSEGVIFGGCLTRGSEDEHQVDNLSSDDFVLFLFDEETVNFESAEVTPFNPQDTDVSFWVGNVDPPTIIANLLLTEVGDAGGITNVGLAALGFSQQYDQQGDITENVVTVDLLGLQGNALLIGGLRDTGAPDDNDRFKLSGLNVTVVPIPAAVWLFGSALLGLITLQRKQY